MQALFLIFFSLLNSVFASMVLAVLLPIPAVERMFVAGLSVLTIAPLLLLFLLFVPFKRALIIQLSACLVLATSLAGVFL